MTQPQTYYRDNSDNDVSGIAIVAVSDYQYRVVENRERGWCAPFWMPEQEFRSRTHGDNVEQVGQLSDSKFGAVINVSERNA